VRVGNGVVALHRAARHRPGHDSPAIGTIGSPFGRTCFAAPVRPGTVRFRGAALVDEDAMAHRLRHSYSRSIEAIRGQDARLSRRRMGAMDTANRMTRELDRRIGTHPFGLRLARGAGAAAIVWALAAPGAGASVVGIDVAPAIRSVALPADTAVDDQLPVFAVVGGAVASGAALVVARRRRRRGLVGPRDGVALPAPDVELRLAEALQAGRPSRSRPSRRADLPVWVRRLADVPDSVMSGEPTRDDVADRESADRA
jgi:hypothetical protein